MTVVHRHKESRKEGSRMEILLKAKDKPVADKIVTLIKGMNDAEQERLLIFIQGANFVKRYDAEHKQGQKIKKELEAT